MSIAEEKAVEQLTPKDSGPANVGVGLGSSVAPLTICHPNIGPLRELHAMRQIAIRMRNRIDNAARAYVRRRLGWRWDQTEKERGRICRQAERIVSAIYKGKPPKEGDESPYAETLPFVMQNHAARTVYEKYAKTLAKHMEPLARELPVWPWAEAVQGFAALGLAQIVGECGDLANYANPAKLWKRMGVGLVAGERQRKVADKELAIAMGYNPARRAVLFVIGRSLVMGNQDGYKTLYDTRKAMELKRDPEMSKGHADRRAQRYMEKRLLRDLWRAWRDTKGVY